MVKTRTISEIKAQIGEAFVSHPAIRSAYGLKEGVVFDKAFSPVSVESVMFYVVASCIWLLEVLFARHEAEVDAAMAAMRPHTLRWYVGKSLEYMHGRELVLEDGVAVADHYDTSELTEAEVEKARVVKFAVATEIDGEVRLKVAGASEGLPTQISANQLAGLRQYMSQIKDAGVRLRIESGPADRMEVALHVVYDPGVLTDESPEAGVLTLTRDGRNIIEDTVKEVISHLPFNGEYRNADLIAALQRVEGVKAVDIESVRSAPDVGGAFEAVRGCKRPEAGYFRLDRLTVTGEAYDGGVL